MAVLFLNLIWANSSVLLTHNKLILHRHDSTAARNRPHGLWKVSSSAWATVSRAFPCIHVWKGTHTHMHTHSERERERESKR